MKKRRSRGETLLRGAGALSGVAASIPDDAKPGLTPARAMQRALEYQQAGNPGGAEALYRWVLSAYPQHFDALHHLGILKAQSGLLQEALQLFNEALRVNPRSAEANRNLGNVLAESGRAEEALASYDRALTLRPAFAEALYGRGNALRALGRHEEALASYDRALAIVPGRAEILGNRGNALHDLGRYEEALASYDQAIAIVPGVALLHNNRGNTLRELKRLEESLASFDRALAIQPEYADALNNRGNALLELKRYEAALASYDRALAVNPGLVDALYGRGNALYDLKRYEEAVASYEKALAIRPDFPYATGMLADTRMHCCDWRARDEVVERLTADIRAGRSSVYPFAYLGISDSPRDQLLCSRVWVRDRCSAPPAPLWDGERYQHDGIRVAYLSADFREHASSYLLAGLFEKHDRKRFDTIALSFRPADKSITGQRVESAFSRFVEAPRRSDRQVAELLRELEVDIAVDLMGFTLGNRTAIFARRCAPIQVNYLGFPGTLGADYFDYIIADAFVIPRDKQGCYSETVVYLPESFQANDDKRKISEKLTTRLEAGLPESGFVFCSFNNSYKISPAIFDVWTRLLEAVSGSVLWLVTDNLTVENNLRREAANRGIDPRRLIFAPRLPYADHLARFRLADLFLDTLPFNAGATASDALWAGVPVLTCVGEAFASRMAGSLLKAIGLPELITHNLEDYEALARELATRPAMLNDIRARLAQNRHTHSLFDTDRFRRHIEAAYTTMWERYQRGDPPESFAVEPIDN